MKKVIYNWGRMFRIFKILVILVICSLPYFAFSNECSVNDVPEGYDKEIWLDICEDNARLTIKTPDGHCMLKYGERWDDECNRLVLSRNFTPEISQQFEDRFYKFKTAVKNRDAKAAASLIHYPLQLHYVKKGTSDDAYPRKLKTKYIKTPEEFAKNFDFIFNKNFKRSIEEMEYKDVLISLISIELIAPYSIVSFSIFCDGKEPDFETDLKNTCKKPEVLISYINNDTTDYWTGRRIPKFQ